MRVKGAILLLLYYRFKMMGNRNTVEKRERLLCTEVRDMVG